MSLKELERLQAVHRFLNLDINKDAELQEIVSLATNLLDCQVGLITLAEGNTQHFMYKVGVDVTHTETINSFCRYLTTDVLIVSDTLEDQRFINNPFVTGAPYVRFYAGISLNTHDGHVLGSLCVTDTVPRQLNATQLRMLRVLSKRVIQIIEFDFSINLLKRQFVEARQAETKLRSFFESSKACHCLIGRDMEVLTFNKNMASLLARVHRVEVKQGMPISQILPPVEVERFRFDFEAALTGRTITFEREVHYPNGEHFWWNVSFEPGYDPEGEIIGISYNAVDITERKLNELRVMAQNKSLKEIAHMQSHELRKPVATILGLMEVIRQDHHHAISQELLMLEETTIELDQTIRKIVSMTE